LITDDARRAKLGACTKDAAPAAAGADQVEIIHEGEH
jgi:hypothetical protein